MRIILAIAALLAAALLPAAAEAQTPARSKCSAPKILNSIHMVPSVAGTQEFVPVNFGDRQKFFLFDTGGSLTQVSRLTARQMRLPVGRGTVVLADMAGNLSSDAAEVTQFTMGAMHKNELILPISPLSDALDGVLALDMLENYDLDIDFSHDTLNFLSPDHCPGKVLAGATNKVTVLPMVLKNNQITVPIEVDGHVMTAILDTGTTETEMRRDVAIDQYHLSLGGNDAPQTGTLNGIDYLAVYTHPFSSLKIGNIVMDNPRIDIVPDAVYLNMAPNLMQSTDHAPEFILGSDVLSKLHIYVALREKKVYITQGAPYVPDAVEPYPAAYISAHLALADYSIQRSPENVPGLENRCFWRALDKTDLNAARADCHIGLLLTPGNAALLGDEGLVLFEQGKYQEALKAFNETLKVQPTSALPLFLRGQTKGKLGDEPGRDADIRAAMMENPGIEVLYRRLGIIEDAPPVAPPAAPPPSSLP